VKCMSEAFFWTISVRSSLMLSMCRIPSFQKGVIFPRG